MDLDSVYIDISDDPFWDHLRMPGIVQVRGFGSRRPVAMLVGEAPGATENSRGRPFCGPSGRVLSYLMSQAQLSLDPKPVGGVKIPCNRRPGSCACQDEWAYEPNAYVTNVVKYRPPSNRTPTPNEIEHAKPSLRAEWVALGKPKLIVCVGGVAHKAIHPKGDMPIGTFAGKDPLQAGAGVWVSSQYHPAYGLRRGIGTQEMMSRHWKKLGEWINGTL